MSARVKAYHEATKHKVNGYAPSPGFLDWDSQPDPFRRYLGAPSQPLAFAPKVSGRRFDQVFAPDGLEPKPWTLESIGHLLGLGFGLSGWKSLGPDRWAMRQNPSSGNLHPTEVYLISWANPARNPGAPAPGVYHFDVYHHALSQRCLFDDQSADSFRQLQPNSFGALGFSSVLWREEWKYGARALRYCCLDLGHAIANAIIPATAFGWTSRLVRGLSDEALSRLLGIHSAAFGNEAEPEYPEGLVLLGEKPLADMTALPAMNAQWVGSPSKLSAESLQWPESKKVMPSLVKPKTPLASDDWSTATHVPPSEDLATLMTRRRSAQRMDKDTSVIDLATFQTLLRQLGHAHQQTLTWGAKPMTLGVYNHNVKGLAPGRYLLDFATEPRLQPLDAGARDIRKDSNKLCCTQGIAGRGAFAVAMFADLNSAIEDQGPWAYRQAHWQAGFIGQYLYLGAENAGLNGTGIGCFLDDEVRAFWDLDDGDQWQPLYHFTVGQAKADSRLSDEPAFAHLTDRRGEADEQALRSAIAATWATREAVKASIDSHETPRREGLARLERLDRLLSELDSAFKSLWDAKQAS